MSNLVIDLEKKGLIRPPSWLATNVQYLTICGSHAYGVADTSVKKKLPDCDVYGWAIPPRDMVFPHMAGHILGFGNPPETFAKPWFQHHIFDQDAAGGNGQEYDLTIYGIVRFFDLCRENNPNMIDALYTPENCVIHCTQVGRMVRDSRHLFLSKEVWKKFRGYAHKQAKQTASGDNYKNGITMRAFEDEHNIPRNTTLDDIKQHVFAREKHVSEGPLSHLPNDVLVKYYRLYESFQNKTDRFEMVKIHGYDLKFAYNILRLMDEAEQIILEGTMDLQRAKEPMKAIRRGDWKLDDIMKWMMEKEIALEKAYVSCKLPEHPPIEPLKRLLLNCLEHHYGSLQNCISQVGWAENTLREIDVLLSKVRTTLY